MLASQDPVDDSPAVLVQRYNITEQKHLELQLTAHQDALQRSARPSLHVSHVIQGKEWTHLLV